MYRNSREGFTVCDPSLKELSIVVLGKLSISISDTPNLYDNLPLLPKPLGYVGSNLKIVLSDPVSFGEPFQKDFFHAIQNISTLSSTITFPTFTSHRLFHRFLVHDSLLHNQIELNIPFFTLEVCQRLFLKWILLLNIVTGAL